MDFNCKYVLFITELCQKIETLYVHRKHAVLTVKCKRLWKYEFLILDNSILFFTSIRHFFKHWNFIYASRVIPTS